MTYSALMQHVPCTLVTGFLGAGKTTLINQLLTTKPVDERWALLINEFGRIGIDGAFLNNRQNPHQNNQNNNQNNLDNNIAIREVSGGCICCTSQLPLQIALTRLLTEHRPQRLIIEPTGLAHPHELVRQLSAPHWQTALNMRAVITVLSGAQWQQEKYRHHEGFLAHIQAADVVVINRYAALSATCQQDLQHWITNLNPQASLIWALSDTATTDEAALLSDQLCIPLQLPSKMMRQQAKTSQTQARISLTPPAHIALKTPTTSHNDELITTNNELPYRYHDEQQGMLVAGWRLPPQWQFDEGTLQQWLLQLPHWQRIKGVVHTVDGWLQLNFTPDSLTTIHTNAQVDSRLEVILLTENVIHTQKNHDDNNKTHPQPLAINWEAYDNELMALIIK